MCNYYRFPQLAWLSLYHRTRAHVAQLDIDSGMVVTAVEVLAALGAEGAEAEALKKPTSQ